jgi:hypothetical protein
MLSLALPCANIAAAHINHIRDFIHPLLTLCSIVRNSALGDEFVQEGSRPPEQNNMPLLLCRRGWVGYLRTCPPSAAFFSSTGASHTPKSRKSEIQTLKLKFEI